MQQGIHILAVDDEPSVRQCIKLLLEHEGHEVMLAESGEAALAQLAQRKFDLVITDFSMPGTQGNQLVARIRQLIPNLPILMVTGFVEEYKVFAQASGCVDALLLKPFTFTELREAVEKALPQGHPDHTRHMPLLIKPSATQEFDVCLVGDLSKDKRQWYEKEMAVLAPSSEGAAVFGSFSGFIDAITARTGPTHSSAVSTFHKPTGFRLFCDDNRV